MPEGDFRIGLLCLFGSVLLLSSAWPLTKLAVQLGTTPLWFAKSRAVLSGLVTAGLLPGRDGCTGRAGPTCRPC